MIKPFMQADTRPLVSVVINNYNYGRFLSEAIQSAIDQTYKPLEVIVVDDGSTDDSRSVIESFGDQIKPILKANGGQASAYNAGFQACTGSLVHFLDSDDVLDSSAIEEAVRVWRPGVSKVHFYLRVIEGPEGKHTECLLPANALANGDIRRQIAETGCYNSPPASGNLFERAALSRIFPMPEPEWMTAADTYPIFLAPLLGEVSACNKVLGFYRVHGSNRDAQTRVTPELLRYRLEKEFHRDALFASLCPQLGMSYVQGTVTNDLNHMKLRLSSLVLESDSHIYSSDRRFQIAVKTTVLCWAKKDWGLKKKLLFTAWIGFIVCGPRAYVPRAINIAFVPTARSTRLWRWTSGLSKKQLAEAASL